MTLPNFLIIGAERCGTTSIYNYLGQHPQVFVTPQKETHFFSFEGGRPRHTGPDDDRDDRQTIIEWDAYLALYDGVRGEKACGEVCPGYLNVPGTADNIARHVPDARLVVILRQPASRAFSAYLAHRRMGREPEADFEHALEMGPQRLRQGWAACWAYEQAGQYMARLAPYDERFGREHVSVLFYDDLARDPAGFMHNLFNLLQVDDAFTPELSRRYNPAGIPRNRRLHHWIKSPSRLKRIYRALVPERLHSRLAARIETGNLERPEMSPDVQQRLTGRYRDSILELQERVGRDLSGWLEAPFTLAENG